MTGRINAPDFALADTLQSGQAFRWNSDPDGGFVGVIGRQVWRLRQQRNLVLWEAADELDHAHQENMIRRYLGLDMDLATILATFPSDDGGLADAVRLHCGLRILRQDPWECLASFIASSTKQIVQIRQIVALLAQRHGDPLDSPWGVFHTFPHADKLAGLTEAALRDCKLGFRAKYLLAAARMVSDGSVRLDLVPSMEPAVAQAELMKIPGVGEKIASCALLFSCGFDAAFPIDIWIERALRRMYFPRKKKVNARQLRAFTRSYFGPYAGWAQQYLFCDERRRGRTKTTPSVTRRSAR
jgi:N-glycosylase/DNA lyase